MRNERYWKVEDLVYFGLWLLRVREYGHGLLVIHSTLTATKVGKLLGLKWFDFIEPETDECEEAIHIRTEGKGNRNGKSLNHFTQHITTMIWQLLKENGVTLDSDVYLNSNTGNPIKTATVKRELERFQKHYHQYLISNAEVDDIKLMPITTNTFEIAWARQQVEMYNFSPRIFSLVSEYLGHPSVAYTEDVIGLKALKNEVLHFDFYPYPTCYYDANGVDFKNKEWIKDFVIATDLA